MTQYCDYNDRIDTIFEYETSDKIADILITELDKIIETIAPSKLIQCKNRYNKWYNKEIEMQATIQDKAHDKAKQTNDTNDWRDFGRQRNEYNNDIKLAKNKYYYDKLTIKDKDDKNDKKN